MNSAYIVFVYLGSPLPNYVISNIRATALRFPNRRVIFIVDTENLILNGMPSNLEIKFISLPDEAMLALRNSSHDLEFRKGFWDLTFRRLLVVLFAHREYPNSSFLIFEADVLIFPNFPFSVFENLNIIMWPSHGPELDAASVIYSPNCTYSTLLYQQLLEIKSHDASSTDMSALSIVSKAPSFPFRHLPTDVQNTNHEKFFGGIFDAAGWGKYITGVDPRNTFGITWLRNNMDFVIGESSVNGERYSFELSAENELIIRDYSCNSRIFNLHIHSKNSLLLSENWQTELLRILSFHTKRKRVYRVDFRLLIDLLRDNKRRGTLTPYLLSSRFIKRPILAIRRLCVRLR